MTAQGEPAPGTPNGDPGKPKEMYVFGTVVAGLAFAALVITLMLLVLNVADPKDIGLIMGTIASPIVAIASAYFGIQVAGKAASEATRNAQGANAATESAAQAVTAAARSVSDSASAASASFNAAANCTE